MSDINIDRLFQSFADQTRLRILHLLSQQKELCVCDITKSLTLPQSKISRHLAYLRNAKLIDVRKDGLWRHYRLRSPQGGFHKSLITCLKSCFSEVQILKKDRARLSKLKKRGEACR